jgi:hypothetical protein
LRGIGNLQCETENDLSIEKLHGGEKDKLVRGSRKE